MLKAALRRILLKRLLMKQAARLQMQTTKRLLNYAHEQLCLHAVGSLLAVFSFLTSPFTPEMKSSDSIIAVIPTLLYGIGYAGNILKNGVGEGENTNDWYGFAVGGVKFIPVVFAIILAVTWGMAAGMLALRGIILHRAILVCL